MYSFEILSDSACDISVEVEIEFNIDIVPFYISLSNDNYLKDRYEVTTSEFYNNITQDKIFPKTSLPSVKDYMTKFRKHLENGKDILCFCLTSKFSGSFQSAMNAKNILAEEFREKKIIIVDSYLVSTPLGRMVYSAAKLRACGNSIDEVYEKVLSLKSESNFAITVDSLEYLQKGGRIGKLSAFASALLDIKPIISFQDGELLPFAKIRGKKKAYNFIIDFCLKTIKNEINDYEMAIIHSANYEEAKVLEKILIEQYNISPTLGICELGCTIGAHIGPSVTGIAFNKKIY